MSIYLFKTLVTWILHTCNYKLTGPIMKYIFKPKEFVKLIEMPIVRRVRYICLCIEIEIVSPV